MREREAERASVTNFSAGLSGSGASTDRLSGAEGRDDGGSGGGTGSADGGGGGDASAASLASFFACMRSM